MATEVYQYVQRTRTPANLLKEDEGMSTFKESAQKPECIILNLAERAGY
jgi:hypothetical protein